MSRRNSSVSGRGGTHNNPILIDDDIEFIHTNLYDTITIDDDAPQRDTNFEDQEDIEFISEHTPIVDNDDRWGSRPVRASKKKPRDFVAYEPRTKSISKTSTLEGHWITDTHFLVPGQVVELRTDLSAPFKCGDFLRIKSIYEDTDTSTVYLRGILYRRTRTLEGMLIKKLNEVYQVLQHNKEDSRSVETQSLHDVPVDSAVRTRCLRHTNLPFPENSFRTNERMGGQTGDFKQDNAMLACRWKRIFHYTSATDLRTGYPHMTSIERFAFSECDQGFGTLDILLRKAVPKVESDLTAIDLTAEEAADQDASRLADALREIKKNASAVDTLMTFADFFCGAGGVSVRAREAGFIVKYGVDHNPDACATYRRNFPGTEVYEEDVYDNLAVRKQANAHVRCCHMSTVCKTISTAYTVRGKNHDANEATLFCISDILRKATPMVATLEQTFGALGPSKKQLFHSFVYQFTAMNYSVKWAVHTLSEYGVPQARKRLIMIAACPGHPLPDFPKPTHAAFPEQPVPGLRRSVTIADAFRPIRPDTPNHNPDALPVGDYMPYSPHQLARGCITTSGGQNNWHYSGKRKLTGREYACLQTFPLDHVFVGNRTSVVQQVGNAVPPAFSQKLYACIRKTFEEVDKQDREWDAAGSAAAPIQLDEDEDVMHDDTSDPVRDIVDLTD